MCFLKPLKIKKVHTAHVVLENGIKAYFEKKVGALKPNDYVLVYGNLILNKISKKQYDQTT